MEIILNTLLEGSAALLHTPIMFAVGALLCFAYKGFQSPHEIARIINHHETKFNKLLKHTESVKRLKSDDYEMVKGITAALKKSEALAKQLRSNTLLKVESKGPFPDWAVMSYDDCYAAVEVSKMDLNTVVQGGRYEDNRVIITLLDADDVNRRQLDFEGMLEETESKVTKLRERVEHLKGQTTLEDVREDWDHWEIRIRDAVTTAITDGDFIERCMDDLHSEFLEHLIND